MFGKKECKNCGERINSNYRFCPGCGDLTNKKFKKNDLGMLGEDDFVNEFGNFSNSIFGGMGGRMMGKMLENAMKMLEKEVKKEMNRKSQDPGTNFQLFINGQRVNNLGTPTYKKTREKKKIRELPQNILKKFSSLPQKDPRTDVRRFSDKVVYEIDMPGVKSLKNISITKLENNIEVKAISKDRAYKKMIPVNFPITNYELSKEKLILELGLGEQGLF